MFRLISQEFLFLKNLKVGGSILSLMLFLVLIFSTLMNSKLYQFAFDSFGEQYLN